MRKRTVLAGVMMLTAAMCAAQMMPNTRADFGMSCGIQDTSSVSASGFVLSDEGEWSALREGSGPGSTDATVARVWHESNWMVDMHGSLGAGMASMHSGQICFDAQGRVTHMVDRFMEMSDCGCLRVTSLVFATDGRVTRREQKFVSAETGSEIAAPEMAKGFPAVWDFRSLEQLPFYSLLKK